MARFCTTVHSHYDVARAFDYLSDFTNTLEWDPSVVAASRRDDEPVGLGTRVDLSTRFGPRTIDLMYEITAYEPRERVRLSARSPLFRSIDEITFRSTPRGCEVTYDARVLVHGAWRVAEPVLWLIFRRVGQRARAGLVRELNR